MTVSGTTSNNGTPGKVDLICTYGKYGGATDANTVATNVAVATDGTFSWTGPPLAAEEPCVLRAVPAGGGLPANLAPFTGPTAGLGDYGTSSLSGGPNNGQAYDFFDNAAQLAGDADYDSVGGGALFDAYPVDPSTLVVGQDMFFSNDYLSNANSDRSDVEVDGIPAYAAATAEHLVSGSDNFTGLPAVSFTSSLDPATGNLVAHESEPLVKCEPSPTTYPPTASSCTSFAPAGVSFNRTIVQAQNGRQAQIADTYASTDGLSHTLDVRYGQDLQQANAGLNFPWVDGSSYNTHSVGDIEPAPPAAPATMYLNWNNTLPDGAENSAQGAITFNDEPSGFQFVANGSYGHTHFYVSYVRTVPAGGSVTLSTTYSWAFTVADVHSLASVASSPPPTAAPPATTTGSVSAMTTTSATVSGWIDPNGQDTTYHFEYGPTPSYGTSTSAIDAGNGNGTSLVSTGLTGLTPGARYYYRLVASNASGTADGSQGTFTTTAPPTASTGSASAIDSTSATVAGSLNPHGLDTTYHFEYGTTPSYGASTTVTDAGSGTSSSSVSTDLSGLTSGTTYYYRLVATNSAGTTDGAQGTFTTVQPPIASVGAASAITNNGATIAGTVNPNGVDTTYHFEYGTSTSFGSSTTAVDVGSGTSSDSVSADLSGLTPGTLYYYRVVATSAAGTTYSAPGTFTTTQPPSATTGAASALTPTSATIAGSINPNGLDTTYHFEYGTTPSYGSSTTAVDDGSATTGGTVTANLTGLTAGTTYYYRVVASSVAGTTDGYQATFTTTEPPAATTGGASAITAGSATITGSVNPDGQATTYHFEYGTTPSYGSSTSATSAGSGTTGISVTAALSGLAPSTKYYYRLVAASPAGITDGTQASFTTSDAPPSAPPPTSAPPPKSTPPAQITSVPPSVTVKLAHVTIHAFTAAVLLQCSGTGGARCAGTLVEQATVKHHNHKVLQTVASAAFSIAAGSSTTVQITLNGAGKAAVAQAHTLRVKLQVRLGASTPASKTLVFKRQNHKK